MVTGLFKRLSQFSGGISESHKKKYHDMCNLFFLNKKKKQTNKQKSNFPVYTYACMCSYKCVWKFIDRTSSYC